MCEKMKVNMKRHVVMMLCTTLLLYGMTACGTQKNGEKTFSTKQSQKVAESIDSITYQSRIISLGNYKGLSYKDESGRVPTKQEVEDEMQAILLWYEDGRLTDDWVKKQLNLDSVEEFREITKQNLQEIYDKQAWKDAAVELYSTVMDNSEFEINEAEVATQRDDFIAGYKQMAEAVDASYEQYISDETGMSVEKFEKTAEESAEQAIKAELIAAAIAEAELIDVQSSYDEIANQIVEEEGFESVDDFERSAGGRAKASEEVRYRLVAQFMMDHGIVKN